MTKTLNQIIFFLQQNQNIFWEKNHNPSPWKWRESGTPKNKESSVWMDCITAKRNLRRAQRQEEARKRNQLYYYILWNRI